MIQPVRFRRYVSPKPWQCNDTWYVCCARLRLRRWIVARGVLFCNQSLDIMSSMLVGQWQGRFVRGIEAPCRGCSCSVQYHDCCPAHITHYCSNTVSTRTRSPDLIRVPMMASMERALCCHDCTTKQTHAVRAAQSPSSSRPRQGVHCKSSSSYLVPAGQAHCCLGQMGMAVMTLPEAGGRHSRWVDSCNCQHLVQCS